MTTSRSISRGIFFCSLLWLAGCSGSEFVPPKDLFSISLRTTDDASFDLHALKNNKASVLVFLAPDCPLSQSYTLTLNQLRARFASESIGFYGVVAGNAYEKKDITEFIRKYPIDFPVLMDTGAGLAAFLEATVTPEVFVVNAAGDRLYRGAIDNWVPELGSHRTTITEYYLRDALDDLLLAKPVRLKETRAIGCFIERKS